MTSSGAESNEGLAPEQPELTNGQFTQQQIEANEKLVAYLNLSPEQGGPQPHTGLEMSITIKDNIARTEARQQKNTP